MPELPEVEVTRQRIAPVLVGRRLEQVCTTKPSYFFLTPPATLRRRLRARRVDALERRGKYLIASLDDGAQLVLHLGMTGQLFASGANSVRLLSATVRASLAPEEQPAFEPDAHTHLRLIFEDGEPQVFFRDVRKFGKVLWLAPGETHERLEQLGPDALAVDGTHLFAASRGRKIPIKSLLLEQKVLAGVGNIYADEALFLAGVRPTRVAQRITKANASELACAVQQVLKRSIETGGSSISDFVNPDGQDGHYQDERHVYGRENEPCKRCDTPIRRLVIAQRSTHYCANCQN